jgi:hypothetical protein
MQNRAEMALVTSASTEPYLHTVLCKPSIEKNKSKLDSPSVVVVCGCDGSEASGVYQTVTTHGRKIQVRPHIVHHQFPSAEILGVEL